MNITIVQGGLLPIPPVLGGAMEKICFDLRKQFVTMCHNVTHISKNMKTFQTVKLLMVLYI
jgi:hypothetical protein